MFWNVNGPFRFLNFFIYFAVTLLFDKSVHWTQNLFFIVSVVYTKYYNLEKWFFEHYSKLV